MNSRVASHVLVTLIVATTSACTRDPSFEGKSGAEWATQIGSGSREQRLAAARAFAQASPRRTATIRALLLATGDSDSLVRAAVGAAVDSLEDRATEELTKTLKDPDVNVRRAAAAALGHMREAKPVDALLGALADPDDSVRTLAVLSLGQLGPLARAAVGRITELATRAGPQRASALRVLPNIDTETLSLLSIYRAALADTSATVRAAAVIELPASVGNARVDVVSLLKDLLTDSSSIVSANAWRTLAWVGERDSTAQRVAASIGPSPDLALRVIQDSVRRALQSPYSRRMPTKLP